MSSTHTPIPVRLPTSVEMPEGGADRTASSVNVEGETSLNAIKYLDDRWARAATVVYSNNGLPTDQTVVEAVDAGDHTVTVKLVVPNLSLGDIVVLGGLLSLQDISDVSENIIMLREVNSGTNLPGWHWLCRDDTTTDAITAAVSLVVPVTEILPGPWDIRIRNFGATMNFGAVWNLHALVLRP